MSAMVDATPSCILTSIIMIVMDYALESIINATGPAPREQQSVETTRASAVMMILTVNITATTSEIATAPVPEFGNHVTRPASQDTITATTPMAVTINMIMKCA